MLRDRSARLDVVPLPVLLMAMGQLGKIAEPDLDQAFFVDVDGHGPEIQASNAPGAYVEAAWLRVVQRQDFGPEVHGGQEMGCPLVCEVVTELLGIRMWLAGAFRLRLARR